MKSKKNQEDIRITLKKEIDYVSELYDKANESIDRMEFIVPLITKVKAVEYISNFIYHSERLEESINKYEEDKIDISEQKKIFEDYKNSFENKFITRINANTRFTWRFDKLKEDPVLSKYYDEKILGPLIKK